MTFDKKTVEGTLTSFGLDPRHTPLSVIAIEFLPRGGTGLKFRDVPGRQPAAAATNGGGDPAGTQFPSTRILRTSTLTPVAATC
jgi:hypothetical protein